MKVVTYLTTPKIKSAIIFILISIIVLHTLYFVYVNGVNVPISDDLSMVPIAQSIHNGEPFWQIDEFVEYRDQRPIFPNLTLISNIVFASWNIMYQLYFGWFLILISIVPMYLILKKTDYQLTWIIILVVAFLFNTAQHVSLLVDIASRQMVLTSMAIIFCIYFINRAQFQKIALLPAIVFAIIASFSAIPGLLLWVVGVFSLTNFDKMKKTPLLIWGSVALIVFFVYFTNFTFGAENKPLDPIGLFTLDSIKLVLLSISNGLIPHLVVFLPIQIISGFVIISLIISGPIYLKYRQNENKTIVPWIQFGLIGLFYTIMTTLARPDLVSPLSHYVTIAMFSQISALIIATMILMQIHNNSKESHKKIITSVFLIFIIIIVISLSASYFGGWYDGNIWHKERISFLECITNPIFGFNCSVIDSERDLIQKNAKILKELHLGPFANQDESLTYLQDPLLKEDSWQNMEENLEGFGDIEYIDSEPIGSNGKIQVSKSKTLIDVIGWGVISKNHSNIDSVSKIREVLGVTEKHPRIDGVYVFIDNKIHTKAYYGLMRLDIDETHNEVTTRLSGWRGIIDLRELSDGCHDVSVNLVKGNRYHKIFTDSEICVLEIKN